MESLNTLPMESGCSYESHFSYRGSVKSYPSSYRLSNFFWFHPRDEAEVKQIMIRGRCYICRITMSCFFACRCTALRVLFNYLDGITIQWEYTTFSKPCNQVLGGQRFEPSRREYLYFVMRTSWFFAGNYDIPLSSAF